jgi:rfaE bifunctional protein nucleotidyltransferase chain/domain/rfaE bifunctional protein kinase chain/domain
MSALVVIGDALLDRDVDGSVERLCPDAPVPVVDEQSTHDRPGGGALAALLAARDGAEVTLVTALGDDSAGSALRRLIEAAGVAVLDLGLDAPTPEKLRIRTDGRSLLRLDRGGGPAAAVGAATAGVRAAVAWADAALVADYGRGVAARVARELAALGPPLVWDPHPRGPAPVPGAAVVTPNAVEAARLTPAIEGDDLAAATMRAQELCDDWQAGAVCVTRGAAGAVLARKDGGPPLAVPAPFAAAGDPCGAGDRFASRAAVRLAGGADLSAAIVEAVASATEFVAGGGAGAVQAPASDTPDDACDLAAVVRARGGTVVATGGCFDLLHPGHVETLQAARSLGDCLIVCLNSDRSVRRLKGAGRPLVSAADRAAVLRALACVDAVAVFDEDTPERVLTDVRPHVWVKGGDYDVDDLPEAATVAGWGGRAVVVPYLEGRSTTRLIEEALLHAAS